MADCPFYAVHQERLVSREIRSDQQRGHTQSVPIPHCTHSDSPAQLDHLRKVLGGSRVLQCGGDLSRCQVPPDKR
jgi:hypothetical protein